MRAARALPWVSRQRSQHSHWQLLIPAD